MPKRRHVLGANAHDKDEFYGRQATQSSKQKAVRFVTKNFHPDHPWTPSESLANWLGVDAHKLLVASSKEAPECITWTTVCVLVFCATQLEDLQESWLEVGEQALQWLFRQANFSEIREDLVTSACALLDCKPQTLTLLETLFHERDRQAILDQERLLLEQEQARIQAMDPNDDPALLGEWQICFLEEPPFTKYYWNAKTNKAQWHNPVEEERKNQERLAKKQLKDQRLARFLPLRFSLQHTKAIDGVPPVYYDGQKCEKCPKGKEELAVVYCMECTTWRFFCDRCCDAVHGASTELLEHVTKDRLRFRECSGTMGFPRDATTKGFKERIVEPKSRPASGQSNPSNSRPGSGSNQANLRPNSSSKSRPVTPKVQASSSSSLSTPATATTPTDTAAPPPPNS